MFLSLLLLFLHGHRFDSLFHVDIQIFFSCFLRFYCFWESLFCPWCEVCSLLTGTFTNRSAETFVTSLCKLVSRTTEVP